jgi:hypothetical protein
MHSRFVENHPIWILGDGPLISEGVLSQNYSFVYTIVFLRYRRPKFFSVVCGA